VIAVEVVIVVLVAAAAAAAAAVVVVVVVVMTYPYPLSHLAHLLLHETLTLTLFYSWGGRLLRRPRRSWTG